MKSENDALHNRISTLNDEMDAMRSSYYKELACYKSAQKQNLKQDLANYLRKSDEISVTLFDSLKGLN